MYNIYIAIYEHKIDYVHFFEGTEIKDGDVRVENSIFKFGKKDIYFHEKGGKVFINSKLRNKTFKECAEFLIEAFFEYDLNEFSFCQ